jgi:hypothetical protein
VHLALEVVETFELAQGRGLRLSIGLAERRSYSMQMYSRDDAEDDTSKAGGDLKSVLAENIENQPTESSQFFRKFGHFLPASAPRGIRSDL